MIRAMTAASASNQQHHLSLRIAHRVQLQTAKSSDGGRHQVDPLKITIPSFLPICKVACHFRTIPGMGIVWQRAKVS